MYADDNVRTPFLENVATKADASALKEFARLRSEAIHRPVKIFHPTLFMPEYPVVEVNEFVGDVMRFLDRLDDADGN